MVLAAFFVALARQVPASKPVAPITISGPVKPGRCRIPLEVGGKRHLFLIDTGIEKSYLRANVKADLLRADSKATLDLGNSTVLVKDLATPPSSVYNEFPQIDGIIGMDVLSKLAFSIDYDQQKVTIWPSSMSSSDTQSKLFSGKQKPETISLISEPGYLSQFMQTSLGEAELDTGASVSLLAKTAASSPEVFASARSKPLELFDGTAGTARQAIVRNMSIGDVEVFCQQFLLSDTADVGVVSANLLGRQVLFDFPHKQVAFIPFSDGDRACLTIGSLLHGTVTEKNGELFLQAQLARNLGTTQSPSVRIVSIDGKKGSWWLNMLKAKQPSVASALRDAYDSLAKDGVVIVERNGKQEKLLIAPFIQ